MVGAIAWRGDGGAASAVAFSVAPFSFAGAAVSPLAAPGFASDLGSGSVGLALTTGADGAPPGAATGAAAAFAGSDFEGLVGAPRSASTAVAVVDDGCVTGATEAETLASVVIGSACVTVVVTLVVGWAVI